MSRDYFVVLTTDVPTPASLGLGGGLLPWPAPNEPWPRSDLDRKKLGYPERWGHELALVTGAPDEMPTKAVKALGAREVVRRCSVQNDHELATLLAEVGDGVCWDEEGEVLFPIRRRRSKNAAATPPPDLIAQRERARAALAAQLWVSVNKRPEARCERLVAATAHDDATAFEVLRAWAPHYFSRPNLGVRRMGHDRELCDQVFALAKQRPPGLAKLITVLAAHAYYPAARQPELATLAREADVDVSYYVQQAQNDAAERKRWFGMEEPLD